MHKLLKPQNLIFIILTALALFFRLYNYPNFLFFIYDQGRDVQKIKTIVDGDLTLIGPTSGLEGFFLGPMWYYVGIPGYVLSNGSPYGIALWYIFLGSTALLFFYWLVKKLFPQSHVWQIVAYALLTLIPGSVLGTTFIWNPLISIPIMAVVLLALIKVRESRMWLFIAFFLLGLVLHSEFAYGVFLIPTLFVLIFWLRQRAQIVDYLIAVSALGITFLPQLLFELKNNFLMTKSLLQGVVSGENSISFFKLWSSRPLQLFDATRELLFGGSKAGSIFTLIALIAIIIGIHTAWKKRQFAWQIVSLMAVIPYVGFMLWRGNHGNFFGYYITPHFIFLILLCVYGLTQLKQSPLIKRFNQQLRTQLTTYAPVIVVTIFAVVSWMFISDTIIFPNNQAGMKVIDQATTRTMALIQQDANAWSSLPTTQPYSISVKTFTPNYLTAQYDYMMWWRTNQNQTPMPHTQAREEDTAVYVILEPDREIPEKRLVPWYEPIMKNRIRIRREKVGILTLETWVKAEFALQYGLSEYQENIREKMCWE